MIESAGNDVIDLNQINARRTKEQRFYTKFITGTEASLYSQPPMAALPFEYFVWMLWSMKESVYKFMQRHQPDLVFSPSKIVIGHIAPPGNPSLKDAKPLIEAIGFDDQDVFQSRITFGEGVFYARSIVTSAYIHTVTNNQNTFDDISWGVKYIPENDTASQSVQVRAFILNKLASVLKKEKLNIIKALAGCPMFYSGEQAIDLPISLAHHGHYVAYCFAQKSV